MSEFPKIAVLTAEEVEAIVKRAVSIFPLYVMGTPRMVKKWEVSR